jgi:hypothetical protein
MISHILTLVSAHARTHHWWLVGSAYYIAVDDRINAVVLGIRGTASFKDALTDMVATLDPFMDGMAHRGIVRAAKWFEENVKEDLKKFTEEKKLPLVIVGHSLGAGTASLLTLLLKDEFPGIKCYALAPPALISRELLDLSQEYVTSIITEDDLVPRFSTRNVERLREDVVNYPWASELKDDVKEWRIVKLASDTKGKISESSTMHKLDEGVCLHTHTNIYCFYLCASLIMYVYVLLSAHIAIDRHRWQR